MSADEIAARRAAALAEFQANMRGDRTRLQTCSIVLLVLTAGIPALELAWHGDRILGLSYVEWEIIAMIGGAISGALYYPELKYWYYGVLPGMSAGPTVLLVTYLYCQWRTSIWNVELALLLVAGVAPWFAGYYYSLQKRVLRDAEAGAITGTSSPSEETCRDANHG
jgi:hypothetical protein